MKGFGYELRVKPAFAVGMPVFSEIIETKITKTVEKTTVSQKTSKLMDVVTYTCHLNKN
jgi:hypothetical protein